MAQRPVTRKTRSNQIIKLTRNENLTRPPLPGKSFLKETTNKVLALGLKRKADSEIGSIAQVSKKRSAFGDITNAIEKTVSGGGKREVKKAGVKPIAAKLVSKATSVSFPRFTATTDLHSYRPVVAAKKVSTVKEVKDAVSEVQEETEEESSDSFVTSSQELQGNKINLEDKNTYLGESSEYVTPSEGSESTRFSPVVRCLEEKLNLENKVVSSLPNDIDDFDVEMINDPYSVAAYAKEIFEYYKEREKNFTVDKYINKQPDVSKSMRAILVDWMVEVQESFELNHETLYLAVKLVDFYLSKVIVARDRLQLVGSTAIFIACKFDERVPPYIDDFLYICDDAYKRKELISLEIKMLKTLQFDLGIPLSYRFLRRYARCAKVKIEALTFARYILELSLMEYDLIDSSDSVLAAAALCLALAIKGITKWSPTLQHYSGYHLDDIYHYVQMLHSMLNQAPKDHLKTIRKKYSHKVFFQVATIPIPDSLDL